MFFADRVPAHLRRRLRQRKTQINLFELLALQAAVWTFGEAMRDARVVVFVDNQAALNMAIRGWSPRDDANDALHEVWLRLAYRGIEVHWAYVPSKLNLADGPSRAEYGTMEAMDLLRVDAVWPP